jgi:hypothetical protein
MSAPEFVAENLAIKAAIDADAAAPEAGDVS